MLKITSVEDLKKYLETRREMARGQEKSAEDLKTEKSFIAAANRAQGMIYAFDEAIKAVEALLTNDHEEEC